jgi:hypothetical protein
MYAPRGVSASIPNRQQSLRRGTRTYRYTFFNHPGETRALAAVELVSESDQAAASVAAELLSKSYALYVEVWSEGRFILRLGKNDGHSMDHRQLSV